MKDYICQPTPQDDHTKWLKSILLRHGRLILNRCAYFYTHLAALPRTTRRRIQATAGAGLTAIALALALSGAPTVQAATIIVNGDGTGGTCSLADALTAANTNTATGNCIAGDDASGYDTIDLQIASATIVNGTITSGSRVILNGNGNTITSNGGGRVLQVQYQGDLTVNEATITGGILNGAPGAGIFNENGTLTLNRVTVSGNQVTDDSGGGIASAGLGATTTINNSTISGNTTNRQGGGIVAFQSALTINDSTITGNTAQQGGGGLAFSSNFTPYTADINRSIISGNMAPSPGSEVFIRASYTTVTVTGDNYNVVGVNGSTGIQTLATVGAVNNDLGTGSDVIPAGAISTILDTNLANNGGSTFTHALVPASDAIGLIPDTDADCDPGTTIDQRGAARGDGPNRGLTGCDAGAFEYNSAETPTAVIMSGHRAEPVPAGGVTAALATLMLTAATAWAAVRRQMGNE